MSKRNLRAHLKLCMEMAEEDGMEQIRLHLVKAMKVLDLTTEQPVDYEKVRYETRLEMRKSHEESYE